MPSIPGSIGGGGYRSRGGIIGSTVVGATARTIQPQRELSATARDRLGTIDRMFVSPLISHYLRSADRSVNEQRFEVAQAASLVTMRIENQYRPGEFIESSFRADGLGSRMLDSVNWLERVQRVAQREDIDIVEQAFAEASELTGEQAVNLATEFMTSLYETGNTDSKTAIEHESCPSLREFFSIKSHGEFDLGEVFNRTWMNALTAIDSLAAYESHRESYPEIYNRAVTRNAEAIADGIVRGMAFLRAAEYLSNHPEIF